MTTDYERGRLAGFAEGVEAAAEACEDTDEVRFRHGWGEHDDARATLRNAAERIRALRAPSPKEEP